MKIGIDIGGSHIAVGLVENGDIIKKREKDILDKDRENIEEFLVNSIVSYINEILEEKNLNKKDLNLIGIASPGTIKNGIIYKATNLGITNFDIISKLKKYFDVEFKIRNDAKCATLAEKSYGCMKNYSDFVYICLGTGIGSGVVMNNKLLKPKKYEGFELGHMTIEKNGIKCSCGKLGCWEQYASMRALKKEISKNFNIDEKELLNFAITNKDNEIINKILDNYITNLSIGIENIVNIFEPEAICIGGSFVYYKEILLDMLIKKLRERNVTFNNETLPEIVCAELRNDAGIIGATLS